MTEATYILLVEPDPFLREMIEAGFRLFNPAFSLVKAENPETALILLRRYKIEAVITELEFPESRKRGVELLLELEEYSPQLPVIILTEASWKDFQGLVKAYAFIAKPPDMDLLLRQVNQAVQENRESILRGISLESFLQVLEVERKTCTLTVTSHQLVGRMYIHEGKLIHAETDLFESKAAAFAMLSWPDYSIKIIERCDAKPTIAERLNAILMEWCVQRDHGMID
jgi:DNA-binding response OmpR family regulator